MAWLSTWNVIKASGFTSYLLLFISVSMGAFSYGNIVSNNIRKLLLPIHQFTGWVGFLFGLLHGVVLSIDSYVDFTLTSIFIPFTAEFHPVASGLGTIAFYMLFLVILSSDLMKRWGRKVWRAIHYVAFPAYVLSLIHGLWLGTDIKMLWAKLFYAGTAIIFLGIIFMRGITSYKKESKYHANTAR